MINAIYNRGKSLLDLPFAVSTNAAVYLAGASRAGVCPFRVVVFDTTATIGVGTAQMFPVMHPTNGAFTAGQKLLGVAMGPTNTLQSSPLLYTPDQGAYYPIPPTPPYPSGRSVDVRIEGIAPVISDNSTAGTPISPGDYVVSSSVANYQGLVAKGALTANAPSANQHVLGISYSYCNINLGGVLVKLQQVEV